MTSPIQEWRDELKSVDMRPHARAYVRRGWKVVPLWWADFALVCACSKGEECTSPAKHPIATQWQKEPVGTATDVDIWWARYPHANVGIATGASSGLVVMDIDPEHGGWESYSRIVKKYGKLPETMVSVTGSGGRHVLFAHPGEQVKNSAIGAPTTARGMVGSSTFKGCRPSLRAAATMACVRLLGG